MVKIIDVALMRELERATDARGHTYRAMMEEAGRSVAEAILERWYDEMRALVLVGPGNNGGDGLVAARYLAQAGAQVSAYLWKRQQADPDLVQDADIAIFHHRDDPEFTRLRDLLANANLIVDALLGTGANRPITSPLADLMDVVREHVQQRRRAAKRRLLDPHVPSRPTSPSVAVVAVDCPSGLNNDTGALDPHAIPADITVTFACPKVGQFRFPGAAACGELIVADIGIEQPDDPTLPELITADWVAERLPPRPPDAHKGTFGKALIVAGSVNYTGAAWLAGAAATRVGTGLVTMAVPRPLQATLAASLHETTWILLPHDMGVIAEAAVETVLESVEGYKAMLVGPGLTREKTTVAFVAELLAPGAEGPKRGSVSFLGEETPVRVPHKGRLGFLQAVGAERVEEEETEEEEKPERPPLPPLVVDADALNALTEIEGWQDHLPRNCIFTPHPGEMARLCGLSTREVQERRWELAREKAREWGQIILLKGAFTVVAAPDGRFAVLPFANPALATAGSGDVLAGAIVGLLAQGLEPFEAAVCGAFLHGLAGEFARADMGDAGVVAGDLVERLPAVLDTLRGQS